MTKHTATPRSPEAHFSDIVATLRARYSAPKVPPCRLCGGELSIQSVGGGGPTVWACSDVEADPAQPGHHRRKSGRSIADSHYSESRWVDYRQGGDNIVIELLDLLAGGAVPLAAAASSSMATAGHPTGDFLALITANQAQQLLDAFGGEATTYALIRCCKGDCGPEDDGSVSPAGLYVYDTNCPEEGVIYLGAEDENSTPTDVVRAQQDDGAVRIAAERHRHVTAEGYGPEGDDRYTHDELLLAAAAYLGTACNHDDSEIEKRTFAAGLWPWHARFFKPQGRVRDLERAGALIAAELDRMNRAEKARG